MPRPANLGEVRTIHSVLRGFTRPWYFAGGWALDLYLGKKTRPHEDIEIVVFRRDQFALREYLDGWSFQKAIPGEKRLEPWSEGELLGPPIHEVHCTVQTVNTNSRPFSKKATAPTGATAGTPR